MKKLISLIGLAVLTLATALQAQFITGPATGSAWTNLVAVAVAGSSTTNWPTAAANNIPVGYLGTGFWIRVAGTNAATTTNATITLEMTVDGSNWIDTTLPSISAAQNGTSGYDVYTNILATSANVGNTRYMRIKSIQNTNLATIFITNFVWSTR